MHTINKIPYGSQIWKNLKNKDSISLLHCEYNSQTIHVLCVNVQCLGYKKY